MAKNRKNQSAAIRFGPALKALFLCLLIARFGGRLRLAEKPDLPAWQADSRKREPRLTQLARDNKRLADQLAICVRR